MDYVGNQRSPLWDDMEAMEDENARIGEDLPSLESEIVRLQQQLAEATRKTRMQACYKLIDPESTNAVSTKVVIAKISGFAKFDVDLKLNSEKFCSLVMTLSSLEQVYSAEKFSEVMEKFEAAYAEGATPPFAGDLENEMYKAIMQSIRDFNASELSAAK